MTLRAVIVDDEPLGRSRIRDLLRDDTDVEVARECAHGREAIAAVEELKPDLMFLDVQMPEMDGFAVLEALAPESMPAIIFVTAYDRYAVRAFEFHALDYLLKSFDRERFHAALERAKLEIHNRKAHGLNERVAGLLEELESRKKHISRLAIKSAGRIYFLRVEEIDWIESADNYVRVHTGRDTHLVRETLQAIEKRLDPERFVRIHRSAIVNLDRVKELQPLFHGDYSVRLMNSTEVTMSRTYRENLRAHLPHLF